MMFTQPTAKNYLVFEFSVSIYSSLLNRFTSYLHYNNNFLYLKHRQRMMNYLHNTYLSAPAAPLLFYYPQQTLFFYLPQNSFPTTTLLPVPHPYPALQNAQTPLPDHHFQTQTVLPKETVETCESLQQLEESPRPVRSKAKPTPAPYSKYFGGKAREVRLEYRVEWKNQNRNIVPNILNQVLSFLLKPSKSGALLRRILARTAHPGECSSGRFYQYSRKIRESITHFVNEAIFLRFLEIHEPNCELYSLEEQLFYMGVCRTLVLTFLRNEVRLIALTSKRMSHAKREIHLVARQALVEKFLQVCRNYTH